MKLKFVVDRKEPEKLADEAKAPDQNACMYSSVNSVESDESLPKDLHNIQCHLAHHAHMESKESNAEGLQSATKRLGSISHTMHALNPRRAVIKEQKLAMKRLSFIPHAMCAWNLLGPQQDLRDNV